MNIDDWSGRLSSFAASIFGDCAHGVSHLRRVVKSALAFAHSEGAELAVVLPAAWLHDCVIVPKDSANRSSASTLSATRAVDFLEQIGYPSVFFDRIRHCIEAHSFSAKIAPETLEAMVVQDADRLDALGAIGIARCLAMGGSLGREIYSERDPFCEARDPDDSTFTLDHFFQKLFQIAETMRTESGRLEAARRVKFMRTYLEQMASEISIERP